MGVGSAGDHLLRPAKARPHLPPPRGDGEHSRSPRGRPRPSVAPHLVGPPDPRPPCLRPWWERTVVELAESGVPMRHIRDPPGVVGGGRSTSGPSRIDATNTVEHVSPGGPSGPPVGDLAPEYNEGDILTAGGDPGDLPLPSLVPAAVRRRRDAGACLDTDDAASDATGDGEGSSDEGDRLEH